MTTSTDSLARVDIDASHALYRATDGTPLVRDLDLGRWAALAQPRDIRRTIAAAVKDHALTIAGAAPEGLAPSAPAAFPVEEGAAIGSGAKRDVRTYYLNEAGALLVATRLRTTRAIALTREVVSTFVSLRAVPPAPKAEPVLPPVPEAPPQAAPPPPDLAAIVTQVLASIPALIAATVRETLAALPKALPAAPATSEAPKAESLAPETGDEADAGVDAPIPHDFISPSTMAARASAKLGRRVSAQEVGKALAILGWHEDKHGADVRRPITRPRSHGDGECVIWRYAPAVYEEVIAYLRTAKPANTVAKKTA